MAAAYLKHFSTHLGGQWMPPTLVRRQVSDGEAYILWWVQPPRISIQWAVIVKYAFIHLECHRLYVKASFTSFQLLSLLNLLINSTCKLDISESIQCEVNKTAIHHCTVTIRIICQQQSRQWQTRKTKQCNGRKKSELEETQEAAPTKRI